MMIVSRNLWFGRYFLFMSALSPHTGKKLVTLLIVYICVHDLWFHVFPLLHLVSEVGAFFDFAFKEDFYRFQNKQTITDSSWNILSK